MSPATGLLTFTLLGTFGLILTAIGGFGAYHYKKLQDDAVAHKRDEQHRENTSKLDQILTHHRELSENERQLISDQLRRVEAQNKLLLEQSFDLGYALLRIDESENYFYKVQNIKINVDWLSTRIISFDSDSAGIILPAFVAGNGLSFYENISVVSRQPGSRSVPFEINEYRVVVQCLENTDSSATFVVGIQSTTS